MCLSRQNRKNSPHDEFARIRHLRDLIGKPSPRVHLGIGDDAAVVEAPAGHELLLCTDASVEGIHFDLSFATAGEVAHKALASVLSDIAAMNGRALYALLSIALPPALPEDFLTEFYESATALARKHAVDIVGGDLTSSRGGLFIDAVAVGSTAHAIRRSGAQIGDLLAVSGHPGASAAGLAAFRAGFLPCEALRRAHLRPEPRFDLLPQVATSMIDISDGLASETHHLARASGVGFEIDASLIPLDPEACALATSLGVDPLEWALSDGEDYELLATFTPGSVPGGFTAIGVVGPAASGVRLLRDGRREELGARGYLHFG